VNSAFRELHVPSSLLRQYNLEVIVSSLQIDVSKSTSAVQNGRSILDSLLVPSMVASAPSAGGYSTVAYPVHKTVLLGSGLKDLVNLGCFLAGTENANLPSDLIKLAVLTTASSSSSSDAKSLGEQDIAMLNIHEAENAISQFRKSVNNAVSYEHAWFNSQIPSLVDWLVEASETKSSLKAPIRSFVDNILIDTSTRIDAMVKTLKAEVENSSAVSEYTQKTLNNAITQWA